MFWVDKFTDEIKKMLLEKKKIIEEKDELLKRFKKGEEFFKTMNQTKSYEYGARGVAKILEISEEISRLDKRIQDLDTIIISKHEAYISNFIAKVGMPARLNDAGDLIKHEEVFAVPDFVEKSDRLEITPDDIWFLKMIKQAYKANNIELIEKKR